MQPLTLLLYEWPPGMPLHTAFFIMITIDMLTSDWCFTSIQKHLKSVGLDHGPCGRVKTTEV